jgi:hypothetical protein
VPDTAYRVGSTKYIAHAFQSFMSGTSIILVCCTEYILCIRQKVNRGLGMLVSVCPFTARTPRATRRTDQSNPSLHHGRQSHPTMVDWTTTQFGVCFSINQSTGGDRNRTLSLQHSIAFFRRCLAKPRTRLYINPASVGSFCDVLIPGSLSPTLDDQT